jgi:hypothetical protein
MVRLSLLVLLLVPVLARPASAQAQGREIPQQLLSQRTYLGLGVIPAGQRKLVLLKYPSVQEDMKISPAQQKELDQIDAEHAPAFERIEKEHSEIRAKVRAAEADPQLLTEATQKTVAQSRGMQGQVVAAQMKVLDRRQRTRLEQIQLQIEGPYAFTRPEIQDRLNMDPGQIEAVTAMAHEGREEAIRVSALPRDMLSTYIGGAPSERTKMTKSDGYQSELDKARKAALKARAATMQRIAKVFTKKQRENYQKMLGEPFDILSLRTGSKPATPESTEPSNPSAPKREEKARPEQ